MAGRLRRHWMEQSPGMVRRLPSTYGSQPCGSLNPVGVITGFGFGSASTTDQQVAETFFAVRHRPERRLPSVGLASQGPYVADKGFEGIENHRRWVDHYGAQVIHPPKRNSRRPWSKRLRRWVASIRQILWSASTTNSSTPSVSKRSDLMTWRDCGRVWRRGWRCMISASGSTSNSAVLG